jgi:hypothetical protein
LYFSVESTALRLITGLGSSEVQPQLSRLFSEPKTVAMLSGESEELNRALVLTLARALHVTGKFTTWSIPPASNLSLLENVVNCTHYLPRHIDIMSNIFEVNLKIPELKVRCICGSSMWNF